MIKDNVPQEEFTVDYETIKPYFSGRKKNKDYWKYVDIYFHMNFHFNGYELHMPTSPELADTPDLSVDSKQRDSAVYFKRLIDARRPSESDSIAAYRRVIYTPKTKTPCFKVYNSLRKIVKASDWDINYKDSLRPSSIADGEYLQDYCEKNYPRFNSIENWVYNYAMKQMLVDANALIYVLPKDFDIEKNEYYEPIATIVNSKNVIDYKENEYAIFLHEDKWEYTTAGRIKRKGKRIGIITREGYWEARQKNDKKEFDLVEIARFDMEYMPAWIIGGVPLQVEKNSILYESFMSPMLPALDEMAREYSDSQAEVVQHIFSTMWYFSQQDCRHCMGTGKVNSKGKQSITCSECNGTGTSPKSPYRDMVLKSGTFDTDKIPTPPAGYIQKQTEIVKLMAERLDAHEYDALSAVNHEFLAESPLTQSGKAKEFDRQELQNYTYGIAYHLVEFVLNDVYYFINEFRYSELVPNKETREKMLPKIAIPQNYDLLTSSIVEEQLKNAKDAGLDPEIMNAVEIEYIQKKFPNDIPLCKKIKTIKQIDPFPGKTADEKQNMVLSKTAAVEDVILSNYIYPFVERAITEHEGFTELEYSDKIKILYQYVEEKKKMLDQAQKIKDKNAPPQEDPNNPGFDMNGNKMGKKQFVGNAN